MDPRELTIERQDDALLIRSVKSKLQGDVQIVRIGREFSSACELAIENGLDIRVDFSGVAFVSSAMLRHLLVLNNRARHHGLNVTMCSIAPRVMEVLDSLRRRELHSPSGFDMPEYDLGETVLPPRTSRRSEICVERRLRGIVIRFNKCRIFEDDVIARIGRELFDACDRDIGNRRRILLDFAGVESMSSAMIGEIVLLHKKCKDARIRIKLANIGPSIMSIFNETRLNKVFSILSDSDLTIAIVDVDGAPDFYELLQLTPTNQYIAGYGEILWIRDGEIIAKARGHDYIESPQVLYENTSLLTSGRRT
jgi:anti-sigma B factor antagonist